MKVVTKVTEDGRVSVEVIDPSDGAVTHAASPALGEQVVVTATTATSPADIDWGGCENIPSDEPEDAPEPEAEQEPSPESSPDEQPLDPDEPEDQAA